MVRKKSSQKNNSAVKREEEKQDASYKGRLRQHPMASPLTPRRSSRRLLEAKSLEPMIIDSTSPSSSDLSTRERVATNAKIVTQETCSSISSQAQDVPTTKKVCKDTPILTRVPISPGDVLMSCTQARKPTSNHSKTGPPCMRDKFLQEKSINDTREEKAEDNFQQGLAKRGKFVQEKNTNDYPEEESENNFQPSLVKRGNCFQEKNNNDTQEEEFDDNLQPCNKTTNPTQLEDHCAAVLPPDECCAEVTRSNNEVSLNNNHTPSRAAMAITEIAALAGNNPHDDEDEIVSCYNPVLVTVDGYRVREEFASQSRNILQKYGDFLQNCSQKSTISRSFYLEMICDIIQRLQRSNLKEVTPGELKSMLKQVVDIESVGIPLEWLHQKLDEIYEAKTKFAGSCLVKEKKDRIRKDVAEVEKDLGHAQNMLRVLQNEMVLLREKILLGEDKLALLKSEGKEIETAEIDTSTKVTSFLNNQKSLVDGLL